MAQKAHEITILVLGFKQKDYNRGQKRNHEKPLQRVVGTSRSVSSRPERRRTLTLPNRITKLKILPHLWIKIGMVKMKHKLPKRERQGLPWTPMKSGRSAMTVWRSMECLRSKRNDRQDHESKQGAKLV